MHIGLSVGTLLLQKDGKSIETLQSIQDQLRLAREALESLSAAVNAAENFWLTELVGRFVSFKGKLGLEVICVPKTSPGLDLRDGAAVQNISLPDTFRREFDSWRTKLERAYKIQIIEDSLVTDHATAGTRHVFDEASNDTKPLLSIPDFATPKPALVSTNIEKAIHGLQEFALDGGQNEDIYRSGPSTKICGLPELCTRGFMITLIEAPPEFVGRKLVLAVSELDEAIAEELTRCVCRKTTATLTVHISVSRKGRRSLTGTVARHV